MYEIPTQQTRAAAVAVAASEQAGISSGGMDEKLICLQ